MSKKDPNWEGRRGKNRAVAIGLGLFVIIVFLVSIVQMRGF